jgi:hypothetical protein
MSIATWLYMRSRPAAFALALIAPSRSGRQRHELQREGATHQLLARVQDLEPVFVLIAEFLAGQDREHFLRGQSAGAFDQPIGHPGTAVGKTLERGSAPCTRSSARASA